MHNKSIIISFLTFPITAIDDKEATLKTIKSVLGMLPKINVLIIKFLTDILKEISKYSDVNKMNAKNLAIVFAPSLLRPPPDPSTPQTPGVIDELAIISQMKDSPYANRLMELFITQADDIFTEVTSTATTTTLHHYYHHHNDTPQQQQHTTTHNYTTHSQFCLTGMGSQLGRKHSEKLGSEKICNNLIRQACAYPSRARVSTQIRHIGILCHVFITQLQKGNFFIPT